MNRQFVAISDLHAHTWAAFANGEGLSHDRLHRTLDVLHASLRCARERGVPWVFAGDLVHTAGYSLNVVLGGVIEVLARFDDVPKIAVWGNHDARGVGSQVVFEETVWPAVLRSVNNLEILDPSIMPGFTVRGGLMFAGAGAQPGGTALAKSGDVGVYHGLVRGSQGPSGYVFDRGFDPDELVSMYRVSVVGDLHHPQFWKPWPRRAILVPGSPEHHNFGDKGDHGFWVVTVPEDSDPVAEFESSGSPYFLTVDTMREVKADGNFYRVRTVAAGEDVPESAVVMAPAPATVKTRETLAGLTGLEVLDAWLNVTSPEGDREEYLRTGREILEAEERVSLRSARLRSIRLRNFGSYADQEFEIQDGVHLVVGRGGSFKGNGAGKTTLFEAIFWLFTGKTTKGLKGKEVLRRGMKRCSVTGVVETEDGKTLTVERSRGNGHRLRVTNSDGEAEIEASSVGEATAELSRRFGYTPELLQALMYFSQERLLLFSNATDAVRKDMIADLVGASAYQSAASRASAQSDALVASTSQTNALIDDAVQSLTEAQRSRAQVAEKNASWESSRTERLVDSERAVKEFEEQFDGAVRLRVEERTSEQNGRLEKRREVAARRLEEASSVRDSFDEGLRKIVAQSASLESTLETVLRMQRRLRSAHVVAVAAEKAARARFREQREILSGGNCSVCTQPIDADHRERILHALEEEIEKAAAATFQASAALTVVDGDVDNAQLRVQIAMDAQAQIEEKDSADEKYAEAEEALLAIEEERLALENTVTEIVKSELSARLAGLRAERDRVASETNPHAASLERSQESVTGLEEKIVGLREIVASSVARQRVYDYWARGFSRQGVQSLLLDEVAAAFNAARGDVFPMLTQGVYDVQLSTQSVTKSGELRERSDLVISEHGKPVPYAALSGGERRRIDVGVMLTLVKAVSRWMQTPGAFGMLVQDETFGFLDEAGAEGLADVLNEVQRTIPSVYVVTHDSRLQALFSDVTTVIKDAEGISRVEGV